MSELLTAEQVGTAVGVTGTTILRWGNAGTIPMIVVNKKTKRFCLDDVMKALAEPNTEGAERVQTEASPAVGGK